MLEIIISNIKIETKNLLIYNEHYNVFPIFFYSLCSFLFHFMCEFEFEFEFNSLYEF